MVLPLKNRPRITVDFKYIISISFLAILLGYELTQLFVEGSYIENLTSFSNDFLNNPGAQFFFKNNIIFFLIISILPFLNLPILIIQMIVSGMHIRLIASLPLRDQIDLFYRHFIFEFMALLVSIYISFVLFSILKKLHKYRNYRLKNDLLYIIILYLIIIILTVTAALLEGGAFA